MPRERRMRQRRNTGKRGGSCVCNPSDQRGSTISPAAPASAGAAAYAHAAQRAPDEHRGGCVARAAAPPEKQPPPWGVEVAPKSISPAPAPTREGPDAVSRAATRPRAAGLAHSGAHVLQELRAASGCRRWRLAGVQRPRRAFCDHSSSLHKRTHSRKHASRCLLHAALPTSTHRDDRHRAEDVEGD